MGRNDFDKTIGLSMTEKQTFAYLFPGQGAQYIGMGKDFYDTFPVAKNVFEQADDILQTRLSHLIFTGDEKVLTETKNSQPAIFVTSFAIFSVFRSLFPELSCVATAGLSLGEYTALCAAHAISFEDALPLVQKRGTFMHKACENHPGTMAVLLGLSDTEVLDIVNTVNMPNDLWAANFNAPGQVVISGTTFGIEKGIQEVQRRGKTKVLPLQVHGAFHSGLMEDAKRELEPYILKTNFKNPACHVVMNAKAKSVHEPEEIKKLLVKQVTEPVLWAESIRHIDTMDILHFIEIGCGKTLSGLNKRIEPKAQTLRIEKVEDLKTFENHLKDVGAA